MDHWLSNYQQSTSDLSTATHATEIPKGCYAVPKDAQSEFWQNYCNSIAEGRRSNLSEVIGNRPNIQLSFDVMLKFSRPQVAATSENVNALVESIDNYVRLCVSVTQNLLMNYFEISDNHTECIAGYLRHDNDSVLTWTNNTVDYAGRIVFPYAHIERGYTHKFLYLVLNQLQLNGDSPSNHLAVHPMSGLDSLLQLTNENVREMYGCRVNGDPLLLYRIYRYLNNDMDHGMELSSAFSPGLHTIFRQSNDIIGEHNYRFWLPLMFSADYYGEQPLPIKDDVVLTTTDAPSVSMTDIKNNGGSITKLERAQQLLSYISITRVENYWSWFDVGASLYSVDQGEEGLNLWKYITQQSDFKTDSDCEEIWPRFGEENDVNINTLEYFASQDNPERYSLFREHEIDEAINEAIHNQEHMYIAKAFHMCFPHSFVCANYQGSAWFHYKTKHHRWVPMDGVAKLMLYINERFIKKLEEKQHDMAEKLTRSRDQEFKTRTQSLITLIAGLIVKLSRNTFKVNLCGELKIYYHKPNFMKRRDTNPNYMATPTGVIDLRGDKAVVRPGKPQDYITLSTRYGYPHHFHAEHKTVKKTLGYIHQVFRDNRLFEYVLLVLASLLYSGNLDKIFLIFSGGGDNSKSMFVMLIEYAFGEYSAKMPTTFITGKRGDANSTTPVLIHSRGRKVAFLDEPNKDEVIQSGTVKNITGRDSMYGRDLFQKGSDIVEMDVTIVPILIANKIPVIPDCQRAIWARTRVVDFDSRWDESAPTNPSEQIRKGVFKLDKNFDREIPSMGPALLWILVDKYSDYATNGLREPKKVMQATENFREANNYYIHFCKDTIKEVLLETGEPDPEAIITLNDMYAEFRKWFREQEFRDRIPTKTDFKKEIESLWRRNAVDNTWNGLQLLTHANTMTNLLTV